MDDYAVPPIRVASTAFWTWRRFSASWKTIDCGPSMTASVTSAPRILIATPAGHWHEFGALACALVASESGWQPYYFGPNLPSEEIVYAARKVNANALALSICHLLNHHKLIGELKRIRRLSEDKLPIFVVGSGADKALAGEESIGVTVVTVLDDFRHHIESLET